MIPRRAQGANKDMIMRLLHGHGEFPQQKDIRNNP